MIKCIELCKFDITTINSNNLFNFCKIVFARTKFITKSKKNNFIKFDVSSSKLYLIYKQSLT